MEQRRPLSPWHACMLKRQTSYHFPYSYFAIKFQYQNLRNYSCFRYFVPPSLMRKPMFSALRAVPERRTPLGAIKSPTANPHFLQTCRRRRFKGLRTDFIAGKHAREEKKGERRTRSRSLHSKIGWNLQSRKEIKLAHGIYFTACLSCQIMRLLSCYVPIKWDCKIAKLIGLAS